MIAEGILTGRFPPGRAAAVFARAGPASGSQPHHRYTRLLPTGGRRLPDGARTVGLFRQCQCPGTPRVSAAGPRFDTGGLGARLGPLWRRRRARQAARLGPTIAITLSTANPIPRCSIPPTGVFARCRPWGARNGRPSHPMPMIRTTRCWWISSDGTRCPGVAFSPRPTKSLITLGARTPCGWRPPAGTGRAAAIENPGHPALRAILAEVGAQALPVPVDADGLPPEELPPSAIGLRDAQFTSAHPTARRCRLRGRHALIAMAAARNLILIEDDYEPEFPGPAVLPALKALDTQGRVIHVGSFSKSIFPAWRLGFLVGPAPFIAGHGRCWAITLRHPPGLIQRTVAYFLSLGHYDALLRRTSRAFAERRRLMEEAIAHTMACVWRNPRQRALWIVVLAGAPGLRHGGPRHSACEPWGC